MKKVKFIDAARREFLEQVAHYNSEQSGLGERFAKSVEEAVTLAISFPLAGSLSVSNTRRIMTRDFPFSVFYQSDSSAIVIFVVAHQARQPGYWQSRL